MTSTDYHLRLGDNREGQVTVSGPDSNGNIDLIISGGWGEAVIGLTQQEAADLGEQLLEAGDATLPSGRFDGVERMD